MAELSTLVHMPTLPWTSLTVDVKAPRCSVFALPCPLVVVHKLPASIVGARIMCLLSAVCSWTERVRCNDCDIRCQHDAHLRSVHRGRRNAEISSCALKC